MRPNYRTHDILQREGGSAEDVIRACIAAFPSFWVSSTDYYEVPLAERVGPRVMSVCTFLSIFHGLISIITLSLHSHILCMS